MVFEWSQFADAARALARGRLYSKVVEETISSIEEMYGMAWLTRSVEAVHPLTMSLLSWPGVVDASLFVAGLKTAKETSPEDAIRQLVQRSKDPGNYGAVFEELRVLLCLCRAGVRTVKISEDGKGRSVDLLAHFEGADIGIEVSRLLSSQIEQRAQVAFDALSAQLRTLTMESDIHSSMRLAYRPYSHPHVLDLRERIRETVLRAKADGLAVFRKPYVIDCVAWRDDNNPEVEAQLAEMGLEKDSYTIPSTILKDPAIGYRVSQKIRDKQEQAPNGPWLLALHGNTNLMKESEAHLLAQEVSEWVYDCSDLLGVILFGPWYADGRSLLSVDSEDVSVWTAKSLQYSYTQTIFFRNCYCQHECTADVRRALIDVASRQAWTPLDPASE